VRQASENVDWIESIAVGDSFVAARRFHATRRFHMPQPKRPIGRHEQVFDLRRVAHAPDPSEQCHEDHELRDVESVIQRAGVDHDACNYAVNIFL
jgi:hypothetical protein